MIGAALEAYTWDSAAVLAAELAPDGAIVRANRALERFAGGEAPGTPFPKLVAPAQRDAFAARLAAAGPEWSAATFALQGGAGWTASDRAIWLRRAGEGVLLVAEPAVGEQERLVEQVLTLNDELVATHRELVRQREALRDAAERIRHLEAISSAGLARHRLEDVLHDVLGAIAEAVGAERAAILLRDERGRLAVRAAIGAAADAGAEAEAVAGAGAARIGAGAAGVPLAVDGEVIGVLQVASADPARFAEPDLRFLEPAAERAAVAIGRAQVVERERRVAETLQRALLPDRLPEVEGFELGARFTPGAGGRVGGDWYDALPLTTGELALVIGDVAGKGVRAAALMSGIRGALRAYAFEGGAPHEILRRLDALVGRSRQMATVALAVVDPATGAIRYASAGHLPPLLVGADGRVALLEDGRSAPLMAYRPVAGSGSALLEPGARLVLYTDGLVERRGEAIDEGLARLCRAAEGHAGGAGALCDRLLAAMHPAAPPQDDTALIAVGRA